MSYKLKLTSPGGETRRLTFTAQPSWLDLKQKIATLFDIQSAAVAISYEDGDGDIITMSSQDELEDYFQTTYKSGQVIKFSVVDKSNAQQATQKNASPFAEELDDTPQGGLPTMGPTMFIEVDDGGWQRLPRVPEIFEIPEEESRAGSGEGHAFVEVVDSDVESQKKGDDIASPEHTPNSGMSTRQLRHKGKQKASTDAEATKSTSSASIVDNDFPNKPSVHVYDVSDAGRSPMVSSQGLPEGRKPSVGPGVENLMGSFGTIYPASPPQDAFKGIPHARDILGVGERNHPHDTSSIHSETAHTAQYTAGGASLREFGNTMPDGGESSGTRTPIVQPVPLNQSSFVQDVANLVDNMTNVFASHPELSEGVRNIIRNAVEGRYWSVERDRIVGISENVRVAAEETSSRITQAAGGMANSAERDAVRLVAEALGGVFRVLGELSGAGATAHSSRDQRPVPSGPPPAQADHRHHRNSHHERPHYPANWNGPAHLGGSRPGRWDWHNFRGDHAGFDSGYRPQPGFGPSHPWGPVPTAPQAHRSSTWGPGVYLPDYPAGPANNGVYGETSRPNLHETKATLEAAKSVYKAEKERFRQEKEERRRQRREFAQKRSEERRVQRSDGTTREEEIVARIPLHHTPQGRSSRNPHTESYSIPPHLSGSVTNATSSQPPVQATSVSSPRKSAPGTFFYSTIDTIPVVPPAPIPVPVSAVPTAASMPPVPPPPPAPPAPISNFGASAPAPKFNTARTQPPLMSTLPSGAGATLGPYPWPMPPSRDPLRRRHLTTVRERIQARLFDMGITPASQPDMLDILNTCTSRTDSPDDDEVLADVLSAMNMRGSPSPRAGTSGLPH